MTTQFFDAIADLMTDLKEPAYRAFYWTSMRPDERGARFLLSYTELLIDDVCTRLEMGDDEEMTMLYALKFKDNFKDWLRKKSNCASSMVTGGSNFNVRRAEKANNIEHRAGQDFDQFRENAFKNLKKRLTPVDNRTDLEKYTAQLQQLERNQSMMKEVNALYGKYLKFSGSTPELKDSEFQCKFGVTTSNMKWITQHVPDYQTKTVVFPAYMLTNNSANMRRIADKIGELKTKEERAAKDKENGAARQDFPGGYIEENYSADRIQIFFDEKPNEVTRTLCKKSGFKWAPSNGCWQRQLTGNAQFATRMLLADLRSQF